MISPESVGKKISLQTEPKQITFDIFFFLKKIKLS